MGKNKNAGRKSRIWRALLAIGLAASFPGRVAAGPDPCVAGVCQGNQSGGVNAAPPPTGLTVSSLGADISPASGVAGIRFASQGSQGSDGETLPVHGTNADGGGAGSYLNLNVATDAFSIVTQGANAHGVVASSIGGNGGEGGVGFLLVIPIPIPPFVIITPGFGGNGGAGGGGGQIDALVRADIETGGGGAAGILATSQAGNGGEGGYAVGIYGEGGNGGVGGAGGQVTVTAHGSILTHGATAPGIFAQSLGGAGGNGGEGDGIVGSGGTSLGSGPGGMVSVNNWAGIETEGAESYGIFAQSVGGFSGSGGGGGGLFSWGAGVNSAGAGSAVTVTNHGAITTDNSEAHAILAQSIGGGGGVAGNSFGLLSSVGGDGGAFGNGGSVTVTNDAQLTASGAGSIGIYAESLGGGGGLGGKGAGLFAFGGNGTVSGNGGSVTVTNHGEIHAAAQAIYASSLGGGGGHGGTAGSVLVSVGGNGSSSGNGGLVTVVNDGALHTEESDAAAIYAWSTGGGGGFGGASNTYGPFIAWSTGGDSSVGATGGEVHVTHALATLHTLGDRSHGIDAVSLGGGGGGGGDAFSFEVGSVFSMSTAFGGSGSGGGDGAAVEVTSGGEIITEGDHAHGIRAASVGGGGGGGGKSAALSFAFSTPQAPPTVSGNLSLGGTAGGGGAGDAVTVDNAADITTYGYRSQGILAQSVGGGGGDGGQSFSGTILIKVSLDATVNIGGSGGLGGDGALVDVDNAGALVTHGDFANGILAQSVGGGGGSGGTVVTLHGSLLGGAVPGVSGSRVLTVGASGGNGGDGGAVDVDNLADITTTLEFANGILAQSVGGGGGYGSLLLTQDVRAGFTGGGVNLTLGATYGGVDGTGGTVTVDNLGATIHTRGDFSHAILAQSVGGGGGYAAASLSDDDPEVGMDTAGIHGGHSGSGTGGQVTVNNSGSLATEGDHAYGILAQSVGGGGGYAALRVADNFQRTNLLMDFFLMAFAVDEDSLVYLGSTGGSGAADQVTVNQTGSISTLGRAAHGIVAQSTGGSGAGGAVIVNVSGDVIAQGVDAYAVYARSTGGGGAGDIVVTLSGGTLQGGSGGGAGVAFFGGDDNRLDNSGVVCALSGMAVLGGAGDETVGNHGQVIGNVDLGGGANRFDNLADGLFLAGDRVVLGTGGQLVNAGTLSPGGDGFIVATSLTGGLTQADTGIYAVDLDTRGLSADSIAASGAMALSGTVDVSLSRRGLVRPGTYLLDILSAAGGVSGTFTSALLPTSTPLLGFSLAYLPDAVQVRIQAAGFRTVATNPLAEAVARHLDAIAPTVAGDLAEAMGEMQALSLASDLTRSLTSLSPETYGGLTRTALAISGAETGRLLARLDALRQASAARDAGAGIQPVRLAYAGSGGLFDAGNAASQDRNQGFWMDVMGRNGDWDASPGYTGFEYRYSSLVLGLERRLSERFSLGGALGYGKVNLDYDADSGAGTQFDRHLAIYGSYLVGSGFVDAVLSYGREDFRLARDLVVGSLSGRASSSHDGNHLTAAVIGGTRFPVGSWQLQPYAGLRYIVLEEDGFTESGAGGLSLAVKSRRTESLVGEVGLRLHTVLTREHGSLIPAVSLGLDHDFRIDEQSITATYLDAPGSPFVIPGERVEPNGLRFSVGLSYASRKGFMTSLRFDAEQRGGARSRGLFGELRYEF